MGISIYIPSATPPIGGIDSYTKLMLHGDESPLVDSSLSSHGLTLNNSIARSAVQSKFGGYSIYHNGTDQTLYTPDSEDFNFGTGDFTIDFWHYGLGNTNTFPSVIANGTGTWQPGAFAIRFDSGFSDKFSVHWNGHGGSGGSGDLLVTGSTFALNTWHHVEVNRTGGNMYIYVNGGLEDSHDIVSALDLAMGGGAVIGADLWDGSNGYIYGYTDELRISKGIARNTTNFTPEIGPYTI